MPLQKYGIFSPTLGLREDFPNILLTEAALPESENVQIRWGEIHRVLGRNAALARTTDTNPVLKYHWHTKRNGDSFLYAATKTKIYRWNAAPVTITGSSTLTFAENTPSADTIADSGNGFVTAGFKPDMIITVTNTSSNDGAYVIDTVTAGLITLILSDDLADESPATGTLTAAVGWQDFLGPGISVHADTVKWSMVTYEDEVYATNGIDKVLYTGRAAHGGKFTVLDDESNGIEYATSKYCTTAESLAVFENYLILGNVTDDGAEQPQRIRWCDISDGDTWDSGDAGAADLEGQDHITGFGKYRDFLIIFKERSYHRMWLATDDLVFGNAMMSREIGCQAPDSIVNGKSGDLYFFASDMTVREIQFGEVSQGVDKTLKKIPDTLQARIHSTLIDEYGELWFSIPATQASTDVDKVLTYQPETKHWGTRDMTIKAFGIYEKTLDATRHTWDTIVDDYPTWADWASTWDSAEQRTGFIGDIGCDLSGYSFYLHNSSQDYTVAAYSSITGYFVLTTDLAQRKAVNTYKRLLWMDVYFNRKPSGTVDITYKRDNEVVWQTLETVNLDDTDETIQRINIKCDIRAKNYQFKFSASNRYEFLGVAFSFVMLGDR